jgi:hypothetical protein
MTPGEMNMNNRPSNSGTKKILLISYHFPPSTAVGGLRIADFAKYLPLCGWNPSVLTIKDEYLRAADPGRLKDVKVERIIKAGRLPTLIQGYLKLKSLYYSVLRRRLVTPEELESTYSQSADTASDGGTPSQNLKRFVISFLTLPDTERNWVLPAVVKAVREIKREHIECILTSSPPYSVHLIGLLTKMITGVRWAADFRDPWVSSGPKRLYVTSTLSTKVETWLEKKVIEKADLVLTTTENLRDHFKRTYKYLPESKFVHITNGYSPEIAERLNHLKKYDTFTLTYTGTLYFGRDPVPIFKAIHELAREGKLDLHKIKVKLVGNCRHIEGQPIAGIIRSYGLESSVEVLDTVPHATALEIIKQSHIALLLAPGQPYQIPAKVFEYMGLGTKILALTEEGATRDLVTSTGTGNAFYPSDVDGIKEFILWSMCNGAVSGQDCMSVIRRQFDRRAIAGNLAEHLDRISGHST